MVDVPSTFVDIRDLKLEPIKFNLGVYVKISWNAFAPKMNIDFPPNGLP